MSRTEIIPSLGTAGCVLYFVCVCLCGLPHHSATYDEPVYIASGRAMLRLGNLSLKPDAPPLAPWLADSAIRLGGGIDSQPDEGVLEAALASAGTLDLLGTSRAYLHSAPDSHAALTRARVPFILIGALGVLYVFLIGRAVSGAWGGLAAAALLAADPTWQAHSSIVACDAPLGTFFAMAVFHLLAFLRSPGHLHAALFFTGAVLALLVKFSAPQILPVIVIIVAAHGGTPRSWRKLLTAHAAGAGGLFVILASLLYGSPAGLKGYGWGLANIYSNVPESNLYYLMGEFSHDTWTHYYPLATLIKLPAASLVAIIAGVALALRGREPLRLATPLIASIAVIYGIAAFDQTNYCVRRILPAYPFLFGFAAFVVPMVKNAPGRGGRIRIALAASCAALSLASNLLAMPDQMSFISRLFGGTRCGPRLLADCNVDWGQDLPAVAEYQREQAVPRFSLLYFGQSDPKAYGIQTRAMSPEEWIHPAAEVYAMSVNYLIYQQKDARVTGNAAINWLERFEPTARAGESIYIYDFREPGRVLNKADHP